MPRSRALILVAFAGAVLAAGLLLADAASAERPTYAGIKVSAKEELRALGNGTSQCAWS